MTKAQIDECLDGVRARLHKAHDASRPIVIAMDVGLDDVTKPGDTWEQKAPAPFRFSLRIDIDGGVPANEGGDPQLARVLDTWASLAREQKEFVLNALEFMLRTGPGRRR